MLSFADGSRQGLWNLLIKADKIINIRNENYNHSMVKRINGAGLLIAPAFIDIHINGAGNADVADPDEDSFLKIGKALSSNGVSSYLPTTFYNLDKANAHLKRICDATGKIIGGSRILGLHLEGPFLNPDNKGGIPAHCIMPPDNDILQDILLKGCLKMMTIAPEVQGNAEMIRILRQNSIVASLGHTLGTYKSTKAAFRNGINVSAL
ncbi:MAG TPA: hypothetical protein ENN84_01280 [Candidatus Marinimicrobia bacterium]|nr:hypothetical protein [Candidatus Neomarinimicrobiota bacterium]